MSIKIDSFKKDFDAVREFLEKELSTLRTGRANPLMVEGILVESYGVKSPLKSLASISVPEARTIVITPWDKNINKDIEKAIIEANIGINPVNEGKLIRLTIPQLTSETRQDLVKIVNQKLETARIRLRGLRDNIKDQIISEEKNNNITEDDKFDFLKELDDITKEYNNILVDVRNDKEKEITTI